MTIPPCPPAPKPGLKERERSAVPMLRGGAGHEEEREEKDAKDLDARPTSNAERERERVREM
jgi:hypothetical protein